jgi:hypothetical protein
MDFLIALVVLLIVAFVLKLVMPLIPILGSLTPLVDPVFTVLIIAALWMYIIEPLIRKR